MKSLLIFCLLSCACGALTGAISSWLLQRRLQKRFSLRTSAQLSAAVTQLQSDLDSISVTVQRLHAKYGMRALRGQRKAEESSSGVEMRPGETRAEWKERMKLKVPSIFGARKYGQHTNEE
jgi:hypothetical protein